MEMQEIGDVALNVEELKMPPIVKALALLGIPAGILIGFLIVLQPHMEGFREALNSIP